MIKLVLYIILFVAIIIALGTGIHLYRVAQKNQKEMNKYSSSVEADFKTGKTLVVFYSLSNKTRDIAQKIADLTNADLYEIKTIDKIVLNSYFYVQARQQLHKKQYPAIVEDFPDFSAYDTIFVGGPVWWYAPATPLLAFLDKADFKSRRVVPFSTQGSNYGSFFDDFQKMAKNAQLSDHAAFNNLSPKYDQAVQNKIINWINKIK